MRSATRLVGSAGMALALALFLAQAASPKAVQGGGRTRPVAVLEPAPEINFPSVTDSNSPAFWRLFRGMPQLAVINSAPTPTLSVGPHLDALSVAGETSFRMEAEGGRWLEAVVPDANGRLFGYYHFEPWNLCSTSKTAPRIGAARSFDAGRTWIDLGSVIGPPPGPLDCNTPNAYFAGGVGDFSVALDASQQFLYFLFSTYGPDRANQGVAIARMLWSQRLSPRGQVAIWSDGVWRYPAPGDDTWVYPPASPILPARISWHDRLGLVDAFWGPSVHWNTFLKRYVMLLNHANDPEWSQEGIYLSTTMTLEDPASWTPPLLLFAGGVWYPQVIGLEPGVGTDRLSGERARFFMGGVSRHEIRFLPPDGNAVPR